MIVENKQELSLSKKTLFHSEDNILKSKSGNTQLGPIEKKRPEYMELSQESHKFPDLNSKVTELISKHGPFTLDEKENGEN